MAEEIIKIDKEIEENRFRQARKIEYAEYKGELLFFEGGYYPDFSTITSVLGEDVSYAWATKRKFPSLNGKDVLNNHCEKMEISIEIDPMYFVHAEKELLEYIREWNKKQVSPIYYPDYSTAVIPTKEEDNGSI